MLEMLRKITRVLRRNSSEVTHTDTFAHTHTLGNQYSDGGCLIHSLAHTFIHTFGKPTHESGALFAYTAKIEHVTLWDKLCAGLFLVFFCDVCMDALVPRSRHSACTSRV